MIETKNGFSLSVGILYARAVLEVQRTNGDQTTVHQVLLDLAELDHLRRILDITSETIAQDQKARKVGIHGLEKGGSA